MWTWPPSVYVPGHPQKGRVLTSFGSCTIKGRFPKSSLRPVHSPGVTLNRPSPLRPRTPQLRWHGSNFQIHPPNQHRLSWLCFMAFVSTTLNNLQNPDFLTAWPFELTAFGSASYETNFLLDRDVICQIRVALQKSNDSHGNAIKKKFNPRHLFIRWSAWAGCGGWKGETEQRVDIHCH